MRRTPSGGSGTGHGQISQAELLNDTEDVQKKQSVSR